MSDIRVQQAKVLYDLGFAGNGKSFEDYLKDVPEQIPENPNPQLFDRLVLVDRRLGLTETCRRLTVRYTGNDRDLVNFIGSDFYWPVEWIWMQDGRHNPNPINHYWTLRPGEIGMAAMEGLMLYAQDRTFLQELKDVSVILPGSCHASKREETAFLVLWGKEVQLQWFIGENTAADEHTGCGSRAIAG